MSLLSSMRIAISGMDAQSVRLNGVSSNIANSSTVGYKRTDTQFQTLMSADGGLRMATAGALASPRLAMGQQGNIRDTGNATDLAVNGDGFFVVANPDGAPHLTRAGSFAPDASGHLVNVAGFRLMGYDLAANAGSVPANGAAALTTVKLSTAALTASPTTTGAITANLPADTAIVASADLPSTNAAGARFSAKTSLAVFDTLGRQRMLDVYFSRTGAGAWESTIYAADQAASGGGFPYASGPLTTNTLGFDPSNGRLMTPTGGAIGVAIPGGAQATIDLSSSTALSAPFSIVSARADGSAPSAFDRIEISSSGRLSAVYQNGARQGLYDLPLARVASPGHLTQVDGNAFTTSADSGAAVLGAPDSGGRGKLLAGALESSTVDLATELTDMIETQRAYAANTKTFQASSDMLDVLMNLKV